MLSKLIAWGRDRHEAIGRMRQALQDYLVAGIKTSIPFFVEGMAGPPFLRGDVDPPFIDAFVKRKKMDEPRHREVGLVAAAIHAYLMEKERRPPAPAAAAGAGSPRALAARPNAPRRR